MQSFAYTRSIAGGSDDVLMKVLDVIGMLLPRHIPAEWDV